MRLIKHSFDNNFCAMIIDCIFAQTSYTYNNDVICTLESYLLNDPNRRFVKIDCNNLYKLAVNASEIKLRSLSLIIFRTANLKRKCK